MGLLRTAVTRTYVPPSWLITLAYSFSAPMAVTAPPGAPGLAAWLAEQAVPSNGTDRASTITAVLRGGMPRSPSTGQDWCRVTSTRSSGA